MKIYEHDHAVCFFQWVKENEEKYPALRLLYAIPNGGHRNKRVAMSMKAEGQRPGMPDYHLPVPMQSYASLYVELKSEGGTVSTEQKEMIALLRDRGNRVVVAYGWRECVAAVADYLGIDRGL